MQDFRAKVAVVTGTANPNGIGFATARRFAGLGCCVVLADLDGDGAEARAEELRRSAPTRSPCRPTWPTMPR